MFLPEIKFNMVNMIIDVLKNTKEKKNLCSLLKIHYNSESKFSFIMWIFTIYFYSRWLLFMKL